MNDRAPTGPLPDDHTPAGPIHDDQVPAGPLPDGQVPPGPLPDAHFPPGPLPDDPAVGAAPAPSLLVLKIGGSLVSDKRADDGIDTACLSGYARQIAELVRRRPGRVVLVAGGGALGHGAVRDLRPDDPFTALDLTWATFTVKWAWVNALRAADVRALPLQIAAMARDRRPATRLGDCDPRTVGAGFGEGVVAELAVLRSLLLSGAVPVLSGDCVLASDGRLRILGSDHVPGLLLGAEFGRVRIVTLTNVPGVLADGPVGQKVVPWIDPDDPGPVHRLLWDPARWETSDAMRGKVQALTSHARRGGECLIMRGDPDGHGLGHLLEPVDTWPASLPRTLIARRASSPRG